MKHFQISAAPVQRAPQGGGSFGSVLNSLNEGIAQERIRREEDLRRDMSMANRRLRSATRAARVADAELRSAQVAARGAEKALMDFQKEKS